MKKIIILIFLFGLISCSSEVKKPEFLIGNWIRTNDKPNQKTYEIWQKDFTGLGFTLQDKDTVFREKLAVISKNDSLFLSVTGVNENPTLFYFTQQTDSSFVCENPKNEFPKKIVYFLEDSKLKAEVSSADFNVEFTFKQH